MEWLEGLKTRMHNVCTIIVRFRPYSTLPKVKRKKEKRRFFMESGKKAFDSVPRIPLEIHTLCGLQPET